MKYKLRPDLKLQLGSTTLYRIQRISDGELGGWVESEKNLSQVSGNAWVYGDAQVYGDARRLLWVRIGREKKPSARWSL